MKSARELSRLSAFLGKSAVGSFTVKVLGAGAAFGLQVVIARIIGVHQYGVYVYSITILTVLLLLATHGWDTATLRYVAAYRANAQWGLLRGLIALSRGMPLYVAVAVGVVVTVTIGRAESN